MKYSLPAVEEYERLIPVARQIYDHTSNLGWQLLLPLFLLSVAMGYSSDLGLAGSVLVRLKRLVLVALLFVCFPTIAEFSQSLGIEIAKSIDDMTGIDFILDAASMKAGHISLSQPSLMSLGGDLLLAALVSLSFIILMIARFFLLAFQHFYWFLLVALGPFFILGMLFESSSGITKGLFKNMFLISSWPVVWSVLSAFLKALPFATVYKTDGEMITVITLNLIIAIALLRSPFILSQLCEGVSLSMGEDLKRGVLRVATMANPKMLMAQAGRAGSVVSKASKAYAAAKESRRMSKQGWKWT